MGPKNPVWYLVNRIKEVLGLDRTMTAPGNDVIDAVNKQSDQIANVVITNEYSTILDVVNAYKSVKTFPFTIQKNGNSVFTDLPTEMSNTDEWNLLCYGSQSRTTLILSRYTQADATYIRTMFNGSYMMSKWLGFADDDQIGDLTDMNMGDITLSQGVRRASEILQPKSIDVYGATAGYEALSEPWNLTYFIAKAGDRTNPTTNGQWRIIQYGDSYGSQFAFQTNSKGIYQRNKFAGVWDAWEKL